MEPKAIDYQDRPAFFGDGGLPVWLPGTLTPVEGSGGFVITKPNGAVLSMQPNGTYEERPAGTAGPWEICHRSANVNTVLYDVNEITYQVVIRGRL